MSTAKKAATKKTAGQHKHERQKARQVSAKKKAPAKKASTTRTYKPRDLAEAAGIRPRQVQTFLAKQDHPKEDNGRFKLMTKTEFEKYTKELKANTDE